MNTKLDITKTVRKSNIINEFRNANTSMAEYRLFCIYLAHFNMNDENNNTVTFSLSDYTRIVGLDRPRKTDIENQANSIVSRTAQIDNPDGGFSVYPIFNEFKLHKEDEAWLVTLECNPKLAPHIREDSSRFIRYKLYNTIFLKSFNQQRIYEILKQYERIGERTVTLEDLREYLSIGKKEYPVWYDFSSKVLKVAQKAIKECTDIAFEYEPIKKGRKVVSVKFIIKKNDGYKDLLKIDGLLPELEVEYEGGAIEVSATKEADVDVEPEQLQGQISFDEHTAEEGELQEIRENLKKGYELTEAQLEDINYTLKNCQYVQNMMIRTVYPHERTELKLEYLKAQERYTLARMDRADNVKAYHKYLIGAIKDNYNEVRGWWDESNSSYDMDAFKVKANELPIYNK